jgi:hypothetical protein
VETFFLVGSATLGTLQVVDAVILWKERGVAGRCARYVAYVELAWFFVAVVALAAQVSPRWLPSSCVLYFLVTYYGGQLLQRRKVFGDPPVVPRPLVVPHAVFGAYLLVASITLLLTSPGSVVRITG